MTDLDIPLPSQWICYGTNRLQPLPLPSLPRLVLLSSMLFLIMHVVPLLAKVHDPNKLPCPRVSERTPIRPFSSSYSSGTVSVRSIRTVYLFSPLFLLSHLHLWLMTFMTIIRIHYKFLYKAVLKTFQNFRFLVSRELIFNQSLYNKCTVAYFDIMSRCGASLSAMLVLPDGIV